jgi:hypothetical protein
MRNDVIQRISQDVLPSCRYKVRLECFLVIRLPALWRFHLNPDKLAVDHANDVGAAKRAEPIEVIMRILKCT